MGAGTKARTEPSPRGGKTPRRRFMLGSSRREAKKKKEEEVAHAAEEKLKESLVEETREKAVQEIAQAEVRDGYRINIYPAVSLTTPVAPPKQTDEELLARANKDAAATIEVSANVTKYMDILRNVSLFSEMGAAEMDQAARGLEVKFFRPGEVVYDEGDEGHDCWVLEQGTVVSSVLMPGIVAAGTWEWKETRPYKPGKFGSFFGERGLRRGEPRAARMTCRTEVKALRISRENYVACARSREHKENLLRGVRLFEQMTDDQIGKLAARIEEHHYEQGDKIYSQGEPSSACYIIETGEASSHPPPMFFTDKTFYGPGEMFGENSLMEANARDATVTALGTVSAYRLSRADFESQLGDLATLQRQQLAADPRTLLANFYQAGDARGPMGALNAKGLAMDPINKTSWFAVYRPCSRDSIAKMLGRVGVGKGLNIKGKSAQKNRLSGFVPFLQISDNRHKSQIEQSPKDSRTKIFYKNVMAREEALAALTKVLREVGHSIDITVPQIWLIRDYEPVTFGLDVPEPLIRETYIMRPDISPTIGWETGRPSVPQFMDMNMHGVRGDSKPRVVLYQHDLSDPMNPLGLLIAYAEDSVKPVCSDFDTFTVGSRGMRYEPLPPEQLQLIDWTLSWSDAVLREAPQDSKNWTKHWLDVIKKEDERGFHPKIPEFGFGDPTSSKLIEDVVDCTKSCGAVRHGAECFNFYFPQELDKDFLVIWDGFADPPWQTFKEPELRDFLLKRAREGFSFPINPVWPVRDVGWFEVLQALQRGPESAENLNAWFPPDSGLIDKIAKLHAQYPNGFAPKPDSAPGPRLRDGHPNKPPPPPLPPPPLPSNRKEEKQGWQFV